MSLTSDQLKLIHVARRQLAMDEADYRQLLERVAGVRSARDLDGPGFDAAMHELRRLGFKGTDGVVQGHRLGMATPAQQSLILRLWKRLTGTKDKRKLGRWLDRRFHVADLRFLESGVASKVIVALERIHSWKQRKTTADGSGGPGAPARVPAGTAQEPPGADDAVLATATLPSGDRGLIDPNLGQKYDVSR